MTARELHEELHEALQQYQGPLVPVLGDCNFCKIALFPRFLKLHPERSESREVISIICNYFVGKGAQNFPMLLEWNYDIIKDKYPFEMHQAIVKLYFLAKKNNGKETFDDCNFKLLFL
jgi:hypothetical protein